MSEASQRLGSMLRDARGRRDMLQEDLARQVGMGTSTLRALEAGNSTGPSLYTILQLMRHLELDPSLLREVVELM